MRILLRQAPHGLFTLAILLILGAASAQGQPVDPDPEPQCYATSASAAAGGNFCYVGNLRLRRTSSEIARKVCSGEDATTCLPTLLQKLGAMNPEARCDAQATRALILRQEITEMVITTSLQVDGFLSEIDNETAQIQAVHDGLANRRDTAVGRSTFWGAFGTAGGAVGSALALASSGPAGNWVQAVSGAIGAVFGFLGYYQAHGPMGCFPDVAKAACKDVKQAVELSAIPKDTCVGPRCSPNMLTYLLVRKDPGFHSEYEPVIRQYLEGQRTELIRQWDLKSTAIDALLARENNTDKLSADEQTINKLLARNTSPRKLSIDDLTDRSKKLSDLSAVVSRVNRDLSRLTEDLAKGLHCDLP